jgi:hypothetical protein
MINQPPRVVPNRCRAGSRQWRKSRGGPMTVFRDAAGACFAGRRIVPALCAAGLLTALAACAAGNTTEATPTAASAAAPAAPAAATTAAAPKGAPHVLTPTEINEQCWMSPEVNKMKDLDAKAKYVDKCVAERSKQQGM